MLTLGLAGSAGNVGVLEADERVGRARGTQRESLSRLLPHVNAAMTESRRTFNLEAFGFPLSAEFPRVVSMVSFVKLFRAPGLLFLVMLPMVLLMKRPTRGAGPMAAH
jgi:hypothetical protein